MLFIPRQLFSRVRDFWPVRKLAILISSRRHKRWQRAHPGASFGEYYAAAHVRKLARGWPHPTLGGFGWDKAGKPTAWDPCNLATRGADDWAHIRAMGVRPDHRVVDYGCGSLRVGQHAIRELDRGCYRGLDVTDDFFAPAARLLDARLVADKQPVVSVISPSSLAETRLWKPDVIFSNAVVQHVPPAELRSYFQSLISLVAADSMALVIFVDGPDGERYQGMNWSYSGNALAGLVAAIDGDLEVEVEELSDDHAALTGRNKKLLRIRRVG